MAIWSEHRTVAELVRLSEGPNGSLIETAVANQSAEREIIREIEADLILTPQAAVALRDWLTARLADLDKAMETIRAEQQKGGEENG